MSKKIVLGILRLGGGEGGGVGGADHRHILGLYAYFL